jgi:hypothetical protein
VSDDDDIKALLERARKTRTASQVPPPPPPSDDADWRGPLDAPTPVAAFLPSSIPPPPSSLPNPLDVPTPVTAFMPSSIPPAPSTQPTPEPRRPTLRPGTAPGLFGIVPPEPSHARPVEPPPREVVELEVDSVSSIPAPPAAGPVLDRPDRGADAAPNGLPTEDPLESRSRLVSAPPVSLEASEPQAPPSEPTLEVVSAEISATELAALEADRSPTSSRRPISMEEKMNDAGDDAVPLHTPPPESGKLRAAAPTIELEAVQPDLPPRADVALFVGGPRSESPQKTFGELLDEALSL